MFSYAVRQGAIPRSPITDARTVTATKKAETALRREAIWEIRRLLAVRDDSTDKQGRRRYTKICPVVDMYIGTGARTNEVLALYWTAFNFTAEVPYVRLDKTLVVIDGKLDVQDKPKTDDSIREVKLPPSLVAQLMQMRVESTNALVFPSVTGTALWDNNLLRQWKEALKGTPYAKVTPTVFRKAVATLLAEQVGPEAAADQLGHADVAVTKRHYIKHTKQGPDAAREHLESFFKAAAVA